MSNHLISSDICPITSTHLIFPTHRQPDSFFVFAAYLGVGNAFGPHWHERVTRAAPKRAAPQRGKDTSLPSLPICLANCFPKIFFHSFLSLLSAQIFRSPQTVFGHRLLPRSHFLHCSELIMQHVLHI